VLAGFGPKHDAARRPLGAAAATSIIGEGRIPDEPALWRPWRLRSVPSASVSRAKPASPAVTRFTSDGPDRIEDEVPPFDRSVPDAERFRLRTDVVVKF